MSRPCSGTGAHAHPAPSTKPGTGAGTQDDTGADPGKLVYKFDGTPKGDRTPSRGTANGTVTGSKTVSRTATGKMGSKLKPKSLTYSGAVKRTNRLLAEVQLSPLAKVPNLPPRTPYSPRGKRKHTGLSPEISNTPTKRTILQASRDLGDGVLKMTPHKQGGNKDRQHTVSPLPPSTPSRESGSSNDDTETPRALIDSYYYRDLGDDLCIEVTTSKPSSSSTQTTTQPKRANNGGSDERGPTLAPSKTPTESPYILSSQLILSVACSPQPGQWRYSILSQGTSIETILRTNVVQGRSSALPF